MQSYVVKWEIDMEAETPLEAAELAFECMQEPNTGASVFGVFKDNEPVATVDLYEDTVKFHKQTREEKYLEAGGMDCPHCGKSDSECIGSGIEGLDIQEEYKCNFCQKTWTDIYELKGVDIHV